MQFVIQPPFPPPGSLLPSSPPSPFRPPSVTTIILCVCLSIVGFQQPPLSIDGPMMVFCALFTEGFSPLCCAISFSLLIMDTLHTLSRITMLGMGCDVWVRPLNPIESEGATWMHFRSVAVGSPVFYWGGGGGFTEPPNSGGRVPFSGDPRECRGYIAILPTCGPPRRQG